MDIGTPKYMLWASIIALCLITAPQLQANTITQNFDDFDATSPPNAPPTVTTNGWTINDIHITSELGNISGRSGENPAWFPDTAFSGVPGTNSYVETPWRDNGVGNVKFYLRNYTTSTLGAGPFKMQVLMSTNDVDWALVQAFTNTTSTTWSEYTLAVNAHQPTRLRFFRGDATMSDVSWLAIDDISVSDAPAMVFIEGHGIEPTSPREGDTVLFWAELESTPFASNLVASVAWEASSASGSFTLSLNTDNGRYESTLPANMPILERIDYTVSVSFTGFDADSPQTDTGNFHFLGSLPESAFSAMRVEGDLSTTLHLVSDQQWIGIEPVGALSNLDVYFESDNGSTKRWSDPDQTRTTLPIFGDLTDDAAADDIRIDSTAAGWLLFELNETDDRYNIQQAQYQSFNSWASASSFGTHTIDDWTLTRGRTTDDPALAYDGFSVQFQSTTQERSVMSPIISDGIGTVMFRYRNTSTTLQDPATLVIQARAGTTGEWITFATDTNVRTTEYFFMRVPIDRPELTQVRIVTPNDAPSTQLLLDDIIITAPGPTVNFSDMEHTPENPTINDTVDVSVALAPTLGASITNATLWFRAGTDGVYDPIPMAHTTGDNYVGTIPRGQTGTMQYYVAVTYFNPASGAYQTTRDPLDSTGNPITYTATDVFAAAQNFNDFAKTAPPNTPPNVTINGWTVNDVHITSDLFPAKSGTHPALFPDTSFSGVSGTDSYIDTPTITNGIGNLSFHLRNYTAGGGSGPFELKILTSPDGVVWTPLKTITNDVGVSVWTPYTIEFNSYDPIRIRFLRDNATMNDISWLGIDDIQITYPPAFVHAHSYDMHPAYPAENETVSIYATIVSVTTYHPAFNITGTIEYRTRPHRGNWGAWENTATMNRYDNGLFIGQIPGYPDLTEIEYRIRADFNGYNDGLPGSDRSPTTFTSENFYYQVRKFTSAYDRLTLRIGGEDITDFEQQTDGEWEGFFRFLNPVDNPTFNIDGYGFYDGSSADSGLSTTWGHESQIGTNLPIAGVANAGAIPITIPGENLEGQFLIRFNELTGEYTVQRVVYQDFENWPADSILFSESYAAAQMTKHVQPFTSWPLTLDSAKVREEPFEYEGGWEPQTYPASWSIDLDTLTTGVGRYFQVHGGIVATQTVSSAALLIQGGYVRNLSSGAAHQDIGTVSFDARVARPNVFLPATYNGLSETNVRIRVDMKALDIPANEDSTSVGHTFKSIIFNYIDANNYYEARIVQTGPNTRRMELWSHKGGVSLLRRNGGNFGGTLKNESNDYYSIVVYRASSSSISMRMYRGTTGQGSTWTDTNALNTSTTIGVNTLDASVAISQVRVYKNENNNTSFGAGNPLIYSQTFTDSTHGWNGSGVWQRNAQNDTYWRPGYTGDPITILVDHSEENKDPWSEIARFEDITHANYVRYEANVHKAVNGVVRIRHFSGNPGEYVLVDNVRIDPWRAKSETIGNWALQNGWVGTEGKAGRGLELRHSRVIGGAATVQSIASPPLTGGASVIAFDHRAADDATGNVRFDVDYQVDLGGGWATIETVTHTAGTNWASYTHSVDRELREDIVRVRIRNQTAGNDNGLLIDNIEVSEPPPVDDTTWWGYNVLVTDQKPSEIVDTQSAPWLLPQLNNKFGAFINNSETNRTDEQDYTQYFPFIQSAKLPDGIGEIRFRYRAWDSEPATIQVSAATNRLAADVQWNQNIITNLTVNQTEWQEFRSFVFDLDNTYVSLRINPDGSSGRVAIDNVLITAPLGASLRMNNVQTIPELPRHDEPTHVQVDIIDLFYYPTNIQPTVYYKFGTNQWGQFSSPDGVRPMQPISEGSLTYRTIDPIPATQQPDTVVQFIVVTSFDGLFAEQSSPQTYRAFQTPEHYWPLDLNKNQQNQTPYFITLDPLPGQVWINEFKPDGEQFIEIVGVAGVNLSQWKVESIYPDFFTNVTYTLPSHTILATTNGYGFFVMGSSAITPKDWLLPEEFLPFGGLQLIRPEWGIIEQQISFDDEIGEIWEEGETMAASKDHRFIYAGVYYDTSEGFALQGIGQKHGDFDWVETQSFTIGQPNDEQTLLAWPDNGTPGGYTGTVEIKQFWRDANRLRASIETEAANLVPTPWYATNLLETPINWLPAPDPEYTRDGNVYEVSFERVDAPMVFYTISVTEE